MRYLDELTLWKICFSIEQICYILLMFKLYILDHNQKLIKKYKEQKKDLWLAFGSIFAYGFLLFLYSTLSFEGTTVLSNIIIIPFIILSILLIIIIMMLDYQKKDFKCLNCQKHFNIKLKDYVISTILFKKNQIICPYCGNSESIEHKFVNKHDNIKNNELKIQKTEVSVVIANIYQCTDCKEIFTVQNETKTKIIIQCPHCGKIRQCEQKIIKNCKVEK